MQSAGHIDAFEFFEDRVVKKCKQYELKFYQQINESKIELDKQFLRFIPKYFGNQGQKLIIQNLLQNHEKASYIDVKIGKQMKLDSLTNYEQKLKKQMQTFTQDNFFRFSGFILKNKNGDIIEKQIKKDIQYLKEEQQVIDVIQKLLKSNESQEIPDIIYNQILEQINDIIYFFENYSYYRFVSSSLFIVVDNINQQGVCKMIDLTHYEKLENDEKDLNYLQGIKRFKHFFILAKEQNQQNQ